MNKTVTLVNEWAEFAEQHPDSGIEEFCRYYLTRQRARQDVGPNFGGGGVPPTPRAFLMKMIGSISRVSLFYFDKAFEFIPEIKQREDFFFLNIIKNSGEVRKTDVINQQLQGLSTGIDTLNRLLAQELITEHTDPTDKRAKLLRITPKGVEILEKCYVAAQKVNEIIFNDLRDDDVKLCIQLLRGVEAKLSARVHEFRDKPIDVIHQQVTGRKPDDSDGK